MINFENNKNQLFLHIIWVSDLFLLKNWNLGNIIQSFIKYLVISMFPIEIKIMKWLQKCMKFKDKQEKRN
jgi:hypothetical protein